MTLYISLEQSFQKNKKHITRNAGRGRGGETENLIFQVEREGSPTEEENERWRNGHHSTRKGQAAKNHFDLEVFLAQEGGKGESPKTQPKGSPLCQRESSHGWEDGGSKPKAAEKLKSMSKGRKSSDFLAKMKGREHLTATEDWDHSAAKLGNGSVRHGWTVVIPYKNTRGGLSVGRMEGGAEKLESSIFHSRLHGGGKQAVGGVVQSGKGESEPRKKCFLGIKGPHPQEGKSGRAPDKQHRHCGNDLLCVGKEGSIRKKKRRQ